MGSERTIVQAMVSVVSKYQTQRRRKQSKNYGCRTIAAYAGADTKRICRAVAFVADCPSGKYWRAGMSALLSTHHRNFTVTVFAAVSRVTGGAIAAGNDAAGGRDWNALWF